MTMTIINHGTTSDLAGQQKARATATVQPAPAQCTVHWAVQSLHHGMVTVVFESTTECLASQPLVDTLLPAAYIWCRLLLQLLVWVLLLVLLHGCYSRLPWSRRCPSPCASTPCCCRCLQSCCWDSSALHRYYLSDMAAAGGWQPQGGECHS